MSGYMMMYGICAACGIHIAFNPLYVPSLRVDGKREAICAGCHAKWNHMHRIDKGLEPLTIHPQAYEPEENV